MKAFPKEIYVRKIEESNGDCYLDASEIVADAIEDDGPTTVGVYRLVRKIRAAKNVAIKPL